MINFSDQSEKKETETNQFNNRLNPTIITNHIYFETRKKYKLHLNKFLSMQDIDNRIPLHLACLYNNIDCIKILISCNSILDLKDINGKVKKLIFYH